MSTRSNIAIKVMKDDYEKVSNTIGSTVNDEYPYIQIYSHADGYPEHMFTELMENFNNYADALKLVLQGNTSGVYKGVSEAYTKRGELFENNAPWSTCKPTCDEQYLYVFENNKWNCVE